MNAAAALHECELVAVRGISGTCALEGIASRYQYDTHGNLTAIECASRANTLVYDNAFFTALLHA